MKLCDYKDHEIEVSTHGTFSANGISGSFDTLEKLQAKIDAETKIKYKPVDGFVFGTGARSSLGGEKITYVKVTRPHGHPDRKNSGSLMQIKNVQRAVMCTATRPRIAQSPQRLSKVERRQKF